MRGERREKRSLCALDIKSLRPSRLQGGARLAQARHPHSSTRGIVYSDTALVLVSHVSLWVRSLATAATSRDHPSQISTPPQEEGPSCLAHHLQHNYLYSTPRSDHHARDQRIDVLVETAAAAITSRLSSSSFEKRAGRLAAGRCERMHKLDLGSCRDGQTSTPASRSKMDRQHRRSRCARRHERHHQQLARKRAARPAPSIYHDTDCRGMHSAPHG